MECTIVVSEISALAGRHKYNNVHDAIINHIIRYNPNFCRIAKQKYVLDVEVYKHNVEIMENLIKTTLDPQTISQNFDHTKYTTKPTYVEQFTELLTRFPEIVAKLEYVETDQTVIEEKVDSKTSTIETNELIEKNILSSINVEDSEENIKTTLSNLCENYNCEIKAEKLFGIIGESRALDCESLKNYYELNGYVEDKKSRQTLKRKTVTIKGVQLTIIGRPDAICTNKDSEIIIIENKNRKNKLWTQNPSYDVDQLALYMFLFDAKIGVIHQYYNGQSKITQYSSDLMINRVETILNSDELLESVTKILEYVNSTDDSMMIEFAKLYLCNEISIEDNQTTTEVMINHVPTKLEIADPINSKNRVFAIYKKPGQNDYKVIRCQYRSKKASIQRCEDGGYTNCIYYKEDPNAVNIWNKAKLNISTVAKITGGYFLKIKPGNTEEDLLNYIESVETEKKNV